MTAGSAPASGIGFPEQVFAPYVDTCIYPRFFITEQNRAMGARYYTLAFVVSDAGGNGIPTWGGYLEYVTTGDWYRDEINGIRERGGNVIVSFGGAAGIELALAHQNVDSLRAAYQSVIDTYDLSWIDFDIEGAAVADQTSIDRRNKAIKQLQDNNPDLKVAFCLPVIPSGLTRDGINLLQNAIDNGVRIDLVNIMAMDYGDWAAPYPEGWMGEYAIEAAESLFDQLKVLYPQKTNEQLWRMIGITPMIGRNDILTEVFDLEDAEQLLTFAQEKKISLISMWSANRDNGSCGASYYSSPLCSSLEQEDFAFSTIFDQFTGPSGPPRPTPVATATPIETATPPAMPTPTIPSGPSPTPAQTGDNDLIILYRCQETNQTAQSIRPWFEVVNNTDSIIDLADVAIRYWYTADNAGEQQFNCDWAAIGSENIQGEFISLVSPLSNADYYLELRFADVAGALAPGAGTGPIQLRFNRNDWTSYNQSNDYSFAPGFGSYGESLKVTGYLNGSLSYGTEPSGSQTPPPTPRPSSTPAPTVKIPTPTPVPAETPGPEPTATIPVTVPPTPKTTATGPPAPTPSPGENPVIADGDYNGDGASDIALFRPSAGLWAIRGVTRCYFGTGQDIPASGDYNGDGTAQIAIFRPASGLWSIKDQGAVYFGAADDTPVPADYNGDGKDDIALYRPSAGLWAVRRIHPGLFRENRGHSPPQRL